MKHKHAKVIEAWMQGKDIEFRVNSFPPRWCDRLQEFPAPRGGRHNVDVVIKNPIDHAFLEWRIKPGQ